MAERGRRLGPWWLVVATVVVAAAIGAGIGFLLTQEDDDGDQTVAAQPTGEATVEAGPSATPADAGDEGEATADPTAESTADATVEPTAEPTLTASAVFSDELVAEAMAAAAAEPLDEPLLGSRDGIATAVLNGELGESGFDLAGLELIVYKHGRSEATGEETSLLLVLSDDSAALVSGDTDSELFLSHLLASSAVEQFGVERLVLEHAGVDDEGPFVMTITLLITDLQSAVDGTSDVFDTASVQLERG